MLPLALLTFWLSYAYAHVALTYPPARSYPLDFLDTFRTPAPCGGMARSASPTQLKNGRDHKITWHLGYPHRGGFKLELLDSEGRKLVDLTPDGLYSGEENKNVSLSEHILYKKHFALDSRIHDILEPRPHLRGLHHSLGASSLGMGQKVQIPIVRRCQHLGRRGN